MNTFGSDSRNSVSIPARTWVADTMGDDGKTFLMSVTRNGDHLGWQAGKLSAVLDMLSDRAYAEFTGEDADTVAVFVLTEYGPVPCHIRSHADRRVNLVEHRVWWRDPLAGGRVPEWKCPAETGFTKMFDA